MAAPYADECPSPRSGSPVPDAVPTRAHGPSLDMPRYFSTGSSVSHGSSTTDASTLSRHSWSFPPRSDTSGSSNDRLQAQESTDSVEPASGRRSTSRRRGYMRPQGTDFAASARARESVLSLGSIAHLQYYFARTGLLDGKGGRLARRRGNKAHTLDLSSLDPSAFLSPKAFSSDHDSSYASMGSSPDMATLSGFGAAGLGAGSLVESPVEEHNPEQQDEEYFTDGFDDDDAHMLPPTTSTYNHREKPVPKPPSMLELRTDLTNALDLAETSLHEAKDAKAPPGLTVRVETVDIPSDLQQRRPSASATAGWYEIQGMNILDVMTLAIRAAKIYYTSHDRPDRLDAIKSEKELRSELLSVMDILKRMASRLFAGGLRQEEFKTMDGWISGLRTMLAAEDAMEAQEIAERASWTWVHPEGWEGREFEREEAFLRSILKGADQVPPLDRLPPLPTWTPIDRTKPLAEQTLPTPFLAALSNGQRLVQLHNSAVRKSRRRFGAIPTFYADTQKPYRGADNLRYWLKAAELRWEVLLKADALGLQYNTAPELWVEFEDAVLQWCRKVREEIAYELLNPEEPTTPTTPLTPA